MPKDFNIVKGASSHYKLIKTSITGDNLKEPYWAVSIEGSPYVGIKDIVNCGTKVKESYQEREEGNAKA
ncbi:MAG TPA: hypothetical protein ENI23_05540 [bacterium]|nr:hypothetical protein [bacterium]